ncbi:MAG TPA: cytochrome P450 [Vicinamibacterales bacterium]|nr:cytochrome P450 [Vicinamibacterales bacterium]
MSPSGRGALRDRPPRARAAYPGQLILALRRDPLTLVSRLAAEHGDVVRIAVPFRPPIHLFSHAEHARELLVTQASHFGRGLAIERTTLILGEGLLTIDGERHRRHRRLMQPSFSRRELDRHASVVAEAAREHAAAWAHGQVVDLSREMAALAMAAVSRVMFGEDLGGSAQTGAEALAVLLEFSDRLMLPLSGLWTALPTPSVRRARAALATLDRILYGLIDAKRRQPRGDDLLSSLIAAQEDTGSSQRLTDRELRDEAMTLLLAGHETTASALTWTWSLLAGHADAHARIADESRRLLGDRPPTAADVDQLQAAEQALAESMRLYPPVWSVGRRALDDVTIGGCRLARNDVAVVSQWVIHRDPRFWPDPLRFDPSRFAGTERARRPRAAYFPFGDGARRCIGESLAWMIGTVVLATLTPRLRFEHLPDHRPAPVPYLFLLSPGHVAASTPGAKARPGLPMRVASAEP